MCRNTGNGLYNIPVNENGDKKEITDTYKFKPDEKQFLYYGV